MKTAINVILAIGLGICGYFLQEKDNLIKILEAENSELIQDAENGVNSVKSIGAETEKLQKVKSQLTSQIEELEAKRNSLVSSISDLENSQQQDAFAKQEIVPVQAQQEILSQEPKNNEQKILIEREISILEQEIKDTKKKMVEQEKTWNKMSLKKSEADKQKFRNEVNAYLSGLLSKKLERENKLREIQ